MADRYWVGGTGTWNNSSTTNWSTTDGGTGGASVPTTTDNVFFTSLSGGGTCTIASGATYGGTCANATFTGYTGTLAGSNLVLYGDLVIDPAMGFTAGGVGFYGGTGVTQRVTSNGKDLVAMFCAGFFKGTISLQDALTLSGSLDISAEGAFTTNNYSLTIGSLVSGAGFGVRTISLGSSTVTITGFLGVTFTGTNVVFNAGTSTINLTNTSTTSGTLTLGGKTFYNFSIGAAVASNGQTIIISGANTFNNLTLYAPGTDGYRVFAFAAKNIINGTLSTSGTAGNRRILLRSSTGAGCAYDLEINSAPSISDVDFCEVYVVGTAAPISGTRLGNMLGTSGITFPAPKTVYWNLAGSQSWVANGWASTSTGAPSTDYFPLAQDTATFTDAGSAGTVTLTTGTIYGVGSVDMSARTSAMTLAMGLSFICYGNWYNGSGTTITGANSITFVNSSVKTLSGNGRTFPSSSSIIVAASYGGGVELGSALVMAGSTSVSIAAGSFDTKNYNVTCNTFNTLGSYPKSVSLGSSTVSVSTVTIPATGLTFDAGTSSISFGATGTTFTVSGTTPGAPVTFYNVTSAATTPGVGPTFIGRMVFNNLTITAPSSAGVIPCTFTAGAANSYTVNGTLTTTSATSYQRVAVRSSGLSSTPIVPVTITANALSAANTDFSGVVIAGAAAGSSPTGAGDCGNNTGIAFPAPKTVYKVNSSANWFANTWSNSSGGGADPTYFPLAQDTAVIDNNSGASVSINAAYLSIGTLNGSARSTVFAFTASTASYDVFGDVTFGSGFSITGTSYQMNFAKTNGTQTLTTNGVSVGHGISVSNYATLRLGGALTATGTGTFTALNPGINGTFDANNYNVTTTNFSVTQSSAVVKMGSGTWTLTGTGTVWTFSAGNLDIGTSNIVLSNTSTTARTFAGGSKVYPKLTIGGATGISTLTITGNNSFTELAATKTVAHTIALGTTQQSFGKWSVTGTVGNVVTVTGTPTIYIMGASTSGVNYLAMGTAALSTYSPGAFYAGVNSTGSGSGITLTAAPAPRTLYWVGGTGNWSDTAHWSTASGGASGAAVPTSFDAVNFDSASNGTTYTVTVDAASLRCGAFNMAAPATGTVTLARSNILSVHGSFTLAATGVAMSIGNPIYFSGSSANTLTTNGVDISTGGASAVFYASGGSWTLGSDLNVQSGYFALYFGTFDTANYNVSCGILKCQEIVSPSGVTWGVKTLNLGSSTITVISSVQAYSHNGLTLNAGTSTFTGMSSSFTLETNLGGFTFYNLNVPNTCTNFAFTNGSNTFNNVTFANPASAGQITISVRANQTISGTLTTTAGSTAIGRTFIYGSDSSGLPDYTTTKTLTCAATNLTDTDFSAIVIAGAAAPASGTRLGNVGGNSGITFPAPKTVYYRGSGSSDWNANSWSATNGGSLDVTQYPLAQDTAVIPSGYPVSGSTVTFNVSCNIGTLDTSARTSNTVVLASTGTKYLYIMGDVNCGSGTSFTGTFITVYAGRTTQNITTSGVTYPGLYQIKSPGGTIVLQDNISLSSSNALYAGNFNANNKNVSLSASFNASQAAMAHTINIGSGTWTSSASSTVWNVNATYTTIAGTGTLKFTSASAKSFGSQGLDYSGITIDQAGSGSLTFSGNGAKFKNITRTYSGTDGSIIFPALQLTTVSDWGANGDSVNSLSVKSTTTNPCYINYIGSPSLTVQYVTVTSVAFFPVTSPAKWDNQGGVNAGSIGMSFSAAPPPATGNSGFFFMMGC